MGYDTVNEESTSREARALLFLARYRLGGMFFRLILLRQCRWITYISYLTID